MVGTEIEGIAGPAETESDGISGIESELGDSGKTVLGKKNAFANTNRKTELFRKILEICNGFLHKLKPF